MDEINDNTINFICSKCFEYYYIGLEISKLNIDKIEYKCPKNHNKTFELQNFILNNISEETKKNFNCSCGKNNIENLNVCIYCNKIYCTTCQLNHSKDFSHFFIPLKEYHITCKKHNFFYNGFCQTCKMNICKDCIITNHKEHNIILFNDIELNEEINLIKKNIENAENYKKEIEGLCNDCIKLSSKNFFDEVEKLNQIKNNYINKITEQISFANNIKKQYENFYKIGKLNYQIISNMINTLNFHFNKIYLSTEVKCSGIERMKNNLLNYENYILSSFKLGKNFPLENKIKDFNIKNVTQWKIIEVQIENFIKLKDGRFLFKCKDSVFRIYSEDLIYKNIFVTSCKLPIIDLFEYRNNSIFSYYKNGYIEIYLLKKEICGKFYSQKFNYNFIQALKINDNNILCSINNGIIILNEIKKSFKFQICTLIQNNNNYGKIYKINNDLIISLDKELNIFYYIYINQLIIENFEFQNVIFKKNEFLFLLNSEMLIYLRNENNKCAFLIFDYKNKVLINKIRTTIFMNSSNKISIQKISDNSFIYSDNDCNLYQIVLNEHSYTLKSQFYTLHSNFVGLFFDKCFIVDKKKNLKIFLIKELVKKEENIIEGNNHMILKILIKDFIILIFVSFIVFEINEVIIEILNDNFGINCFFIFILLFCSFYFWFKKINFDII